MTPVDPRSKDMRGIRNSLDVRAASLAPRVFIMNMVRLQSFQAVLTSCG